MSDLDLKRSYVCGMYPGKNWKHKVERMSDEQIIAIYLKSHTEGELPTHIEEHVSDDQVDFDDIGTASVSGLGPHHNEDDFPLY